MDIVTVVWQWTDDASERYWFFTHHSHNTPVLHLPVVIESSDKTVYSSYFFRIETRLKVKLRVKDFAQRPAAPRTCLGESQISRQDQSESPRAACFPLAGKLPISPEAATNTKYTAPTDRKPTKYPDDQYPFQSAGNHPQACFQDGSESGLESESSPEL